MTATCCGPPTPRRFSGTERWRRRRLARFAVLFVWACAPLDRVFGQALHRAGKLGAGSGRLVVDVDSLSARCMATSSAAPGTAAPASSVTTRSSQHAPTPNEVVHVRMRNGRANTQRGVLRFVDELIARVRQAGASGPLLLRADFGFWNKKVCARLRAQGCECSIGVTMHKIVTAQIAPIAMTPGSRSPSTPTAVSARWPRRRSARTVSPDFAARWAPRPWLGRRNVRSSRVF
jgi:hypothetical protein